MMGILESMSQSKIIKLVGNMNSYTFTNISYKIPIGYLIDRPVMMSLIVVAFGYLNPSCLYRREASG